MCVVGSGVMGTTGPFCCFVDGLSDVFFFPSSPLFLVEDEVDDIIAILLFVTVVLDEIP